MQRRQYVLCMALATSLAANLPLRAQQKKQASSTIPVAIQITAARNVFIFNAGGENPSEGVDPRMVPFTGGPDRAYNEFFAAMKQWGRYKLLPSPAGAGLIFEISFNRIPVEVPVDAEERRSRRLHNHPNRPLDTMIVYDPQFDLIIRDPGTRTVLRAFTRRFDRKPPGLDRKFDQAMTSLVEDVAALVGQSGAVEAVESTMVSAAPVPAQISTARKIFIANAREDGAGVDSARVDNAGVDSAGSDRVYNQFYALMKNWGRYDLASSPAGADLVLRVSSADSRLHSGVERQVNLVVIDPKTGNGLWTFLQNVKSALLPMNANKNLQQAVSAVASRLARMSGQPAAALAAPKKTSPAPSPAQIGAVTRVFIANAAGRPASGAIQESDQVYNSFYAAMKRWGRYELVASPGAADVVFQLSFDSTAVRLLVVDPRARTALLDIAERAHGQGKLSKTKSPEEFDETIGALMDQVARLAGQIDAAVAVPAALNAAPVPPQLGAARKLFIAYPRADQIGCEGQAEELYRQVYAALDRWGHYQLTTTTADAEIILEPTVEAPAPLSYESGTVYRLIFRDPGTHAVLWGISQHVDMPFLSRNVQKTVDRAIDALMNKVREAVDRVPASAEKKTQGALPARDEFSGGPGRIRT